MWSRSQRSYEAVRDLVAILTVLVKGAAINFAGENEVFLRESVQLVLVGRAWPQLLSFLFYCLLDGVGSLLVLEVCFNLILPFTEKYLFETVLIFNILLLCNVSFYCQQY